jgi:RNA polymerase sigma-70 factor (ECF subfamily)
MKGAALRALIDKATRGSRESFDQLLGLHRPRLEALIRLRMGAWLRSQVEVEDVLQETSLEAFRSVGTFQWTGDGSFGKWLGGIAEHVIHTNLRKWKARKRRPGQAARPDGPGVDAGNTTSLSFAGKATTPLNALLREERFSRLEKAIGSLKASHREVIILARVRGLPLREIAAQMGSTPKAVSMLLVRAQRSLRAAFGHTDSFSLPARSLDQAPRLSLDDPMQSTTIGSP